MPPRPKARHTWTFLRRFRRGAFGWRSQPAVHRIREAVAEIRKVARNHPALAAEGAVRFVERVSAALVNVDSSSGTVGNAVRHAIADLVPVIVQASPDDDVERAAWMERLWAAHEADEMPYLESLGELWGALCVTPERASAWADRLFASTRAELRKNGPFFRGTMACLSALFTAGRYDDILALLRGPTIWPYQRWAVDALVADGRKAEALEYAEAQRRHPVDPAIDVVCEQILLSSGLADEAYRRYGCIHREGTYLATFRRVTATYPHKAARDVLADLAAGTPGKEGKWFAAANDAGLFDEALDFARRGPCDPRTLARAARDALDAEPAFALESAQLAIQAIVDGRGFEITMLDVWEARDLALSAASRLGLLDQAIERMRHSSAGADAVSRFVREALGPLPSRATDRHLIPDSVR